MIIEIVSIRKLSTNDLAEINTFRSQEFGVEIPINSISSNEDQDSFYFLLKDGNDMLAFAMVSELPLKFRNESVSVLCVSTMIATQKGKRYGTRVLAEIQKYAKEKGRTLLGFCETDLIPYYQKSGFSILSNEDNQFVYIDEKGKIIPKIVPGEVFYRDGADGVISRILSEADKQVKVSRSGAV
jgi:N-acetylglutamate synthase-like GNAT family acetyltransferase